MAELLKLNTLLSGRRAMFVDVVIFVVYRSRKSLSHLKSILLFLVSIHSYFKGSFKKYFNVKDCYATEIFKVIFYTFNNALHFGLLQYREFFFIARVSLSHWGTFLQTLC